MKWIHAVFRRNQESSLSLSACFDAGKRHWMILGITAFGALLRLFYVFRTPYSLRSYDAEGHVDYIFYVLTHWSIPPADLAWQSYQPPLYYFFSAILSAPFHFFGAERESIILLLQIE